MRRSIVEVAAGTPVDTLTRRVVGGSERYEPAVTLTQADSDAPLPTMPFPRSGGENLRGRRFGRMTVVGYSAEKRGRWVVRCSCGVFTLRTAKAIRNAANSADACQRCRHADNLRHLSAVGAGLKREDRTL